MIEYWGIREAVKRKLWELYKQELHTLGVSAAAHQRVLGISVRRDSSVCRLAYAVAVTMGVSIFWNGKDVGIDALKAEAGITIGDETVASVKKGGLTVSDVVARLETILVNLKRLPARQPITVMSDFRASVGIDLETTFGGKE